MGFGNVKKYSSKLKSLVDANLNERKELIHSASDTLIKILCDCCLNILKEVVEINSQEKNKLKRFSNVIRTLAKPKLNIENRRKLLIKNSGLIPVIITAVLRLL